MQSPTLVTADHCARYAKNLICITCCLVVILHSNSCIYPSQACQSFVILIPGREINVTAIYPIRPAGSRLLFTNWLTTVPCLLIILIKYLSKPFQASTIGITIIHFSIIMGFFSKKKSVSPDAQVDSTATNTDTPQLGTSFMTQSIVS